MHVEPSQKYFIVLQFIFSWSVLEIETDGSYPDDVQAYAAGIVEGALTWYPIHAHLDNTIRSICKNREKQCEKLREALDRSVDKWKSYAAENQKDPFWHQVIKFIIKYYFDRPNTRYSTKEHTSADGQNFMLCVACSG